MWNITTLVLGLAILLLAYIAWPKQHTKVKSLEPPLVTSKVPVIGHLLAFLYYGIEYFSLQSAKSPSLPAFTLDMLVNKVYVVISPDLVSAVRRSHRTMSFDPLIARTAKCVGGIKGPGLELLSEKVAQGGGLGYETMVTLRGTLLGEGLDQLNGTMIGCLRRSMEELRKTGLERSVDLYDWCTLVMTVATTDAVYGPLNPYKRKSVRDAYSEIDNNLSLLMMDFAPWLIARTAWKGREYLTQSFLRYFRTGGHRHLNASKLIYARWSTQDAAGAAFENIARMETVMGLGLLSNTIPSGFWFIFDIFSRPELQEEIRDQIIQNAVSIDSDGVHAVDMADVRDTCPLLLASFQETLRFRSNAAQFRYIYEDTMLGEYLVKGGSILVLPAAGINRSVSTWGADADTYNPRRFLDSEMSRREKASGFLSFGISPHICAGRHFATGEILALMTMLVLQFDIRPSGGEWVEPPINVKAVAASLTPPAGRMSGTFSERKGQPGAGWRFHISPGKGMHGLVIG